MAQPAGLAWPGSACYQLSITVRCSAPFRRAGHHCVGYAVDGLRGGRDAILRPDEGIYQNLAPMVDGRNLDDLSPTVEPGCFGVEVDRTGVHGYRRCPGNGITADTRPIGISRLAQVASPYHDSCRIPENRGHWYRSRDPDPTKRNLARKIDRYDEQL